jgi:hypothetical protein
MPDLVNQGHKIEIRSGGVSKQQENSRRGNGKNCWGRGELGPSATLCVPVYPFGTR